MLRASEYIGHEDAKHPHEYNEKGYDRYSVRFEIGGENFSGELLVAIGDNRKRIFYDVVKIKRTDSPVSEASVRKTDGISTRGAIGSEAGEPHTAQNRNADASTTDIISEKASDVNPSVKKYRCSFGQNIRASAFKKFSAPPPLQAESGGTAYSGLSLFFRIPSPLGRSVFTARPGFFKTGIQRLIAAK